jgi:Flp pilus assembly protein TadD
MSDLSIGEALDLGAGYAMAGDHPSAMAMFRGVLVHEPENFEAIERLGTSLFETGKLHEALYWFWRGRKINRRNPIALSHYGLCVAQLGHPEEGLADLERAAHHTAKTPLSPAAKALIYNNLGNTLERLGRHEAALVALDKGIAFDPSDPFPHYNRGIALLRLNRHREAIASLDHSLELRAPATDSVSRLNEADARYNRAMARLLLGDLRGFADYEARLTSSENDTPNLNLPADKKWQGEALTGKTILIHAEQGLGDTIQFLRFVPLIRERAGNVLLRVHDKLTPLVRDIPGVTVLELAAGDTVEGFERWAALMSLPLYLGIDTEQDLPPPWQPSIEPERVARLRASLDPPANELNVGVCWAGNFQHKNDAHRSIPLAKFGAIFEAKANFVSIQQMRAGETNEFAALQRRHPFLSALWLDDLRDTAAAIAALDLVVTVDTAVAHLAATLGVPTWILIPAYSTDWRWQLGRTDSPWYPRATLYRQPKVGDWQTVLDHVTRDLDAMAAQRAAA